MQEANSEDPLGMGWIFFNHFLSLVPGTVSLAKNRLTDMMRALSVPKKGNAKEEVGCSPFSKGALFWPLIFNKGTEKPQ